MSESIDYWIRQHTSARAAEMAMRREVVALRQAIEAAARTLSGPEATAWCASTPADNDRTSDAYITALIGAILRINAVPEEGVSPRALEFRLCEAGHIILKPNQKYIFTVDPKCDACLTAAARAAGCRSLADVARVMNGGEVVDAEIERDEPSELDVELSFSSTEGRWVEFDGTVTVLPGGSRIHNPCPVPAGITTEVKFRDGKSIRTSNPEHMRWGWTRPYVAQADIVAWRL